MVRSSREEDASGNVSDNDGNESDESGSSSSSEEPVIEYLAQNRSRRMNAGSKMSSLIESTSHEDEFYKSAYGGFNEDEADDVFNSPVHSDVDEVDSDFDKPEEDDEPVSDTEEGGEKKVKRKKAFKEPVRGSRDELLAKNKKWAIARMGGPTVAANSVDAKTQSQRLKEAVETEKANVESLKRYEQFELERKRKREKVGSSRRVPHPCISVRRDKNGTEMVLPSVREFKKPSVPFQYVCAVTGRPAKYRDPVTQLPYASSYAFKVIRDKYTKHLKTVRNNDNVAQFLSHFE